jgi:hypothetical protein
MSFVLDPPLLVVSGAAAEIASGGDRTASRRLRGGIVGLFVGVSLALYANLPGLGFLWRPFGSRSGREFMLTSGLGRLDGRPLGGRRHAAALSLFALYPLWARLGAALVRASRSS